MPEHPDSPEARLQREAQFHDHTYSHGTREPALKYYAVTDRSRGDYLKLLLQFGRSKRVLEYGCGQGSYAFNLAAEHATVSGIDISPVAIEQSVTRARQEGVSDRAQFFVMDAEATSFKAESFDLVCGTGILHHLDLAKSYAEIRRLLVPGGRAVFSEPLGHNPLINWYRSRTPAMRTPDEHPLLMNDLKLANEYFNGVELRYYHCFDLTTIPLRNTPLFQPAKQLTALADRILLSTFSPFRRLAWMVTLIMTK